MKPKVHLFLRSSVLLIVVLLVACVAPPAAPPAPAPATAVPASPTAPLAPATAIPQAAAPEPPATTGDVKLTIVYDNYTTDVQLTPEHGYAAVVETGGHTLLFDTGTNGPVLLENMRKLGIDPQSIEAVVLSHEHIDHTGGLQALLDMGIRPTVYALSTFLGSWKEGIRAQTELVEVEESMEILPGVHTTHPIGSTPEQALVLETPDGAVVLTGCAHPGVVNMVGEAQKVAGDKIALLAGGFHLGDTIDSNLPPIVAEVRQAGVQKIMPSHCTGKRAIALFEAEYGENYIKGGVGRTLSFTAAQAKPIPIIWDDDGSIDGVTALLYFLQHPSFEVKAATVSPGIAHPGVFASNLARFFARLGVEDVPIAAGPDQPLAGDNAFPEAWRSASDKFWDLELPEAAKPVDERTAAQLMADVIRSSDQPVTVFVSGPLTNLAQALRDDPSLKEGIRSVEIMGGAVKAPGNVELPGQGLLPAEWNIYIDPVAAGEVFSSGVPIHLTPLDATDKIPWTESDAAAWESSDAPASSVATQFLRRTLRDWSSSQILIWDLVAALNAANPDLCQWEDVHLEVAQAGAANEGQTVLVDDQPANASVCLTPNSSAYKNAAQEQFGETP